MAKKIFDFKFKGDIKLMDKFLNASRIQRTLEQEVRKAVIKNSLIVIREIGLTVREGKFVENRPLTLALSKGTKVLLKEKNMLDALSFKLKSSFESEVGYIKDSQTTGGVTGKAGSMLKVVELIHEGYVIKVTPKMVAAIMAALREKKTKKGNLKKSSKAGLKAFEATRKGGTKTWRVPPRKFMEETFKKPELAKMINQGWREALERTFKRLGAIGGEHKDR